MEARMSLKARRELLHSIRARYMRADKPLKTKILDEFMLATGYGRKRAVALLNKNDEQTQRPRGSGRRQKYGEDVKQALVHLWRIANEICSTVLGFDSDNGSEFINFGLREFCQTEGITFTRSRPYKKSDQCHVEQKNGSVVRRIVGYDRYEGQQSKECLQNLHDVMHPSVNFFQPSMKLVSKHREGSKTSRKYDVAQTPFTRMLNYSSVSEGTKQRLQDVYLDLDPVLLMEQLEQLQDALWKHAGKPSNEFSIKGVTVLPEEKAPILISSLRKQSESPQAAQQAATAGALLTQLEPVLRQYRKTPKTRKPHPPHTWRTRKDPFEEVSEQLRLRFDSAEFGSILLVTFFQRTIKPYQF